MKNREFNFFPLRRGVLACISTTREVFFLISLYCLGLTELCHFPSKIQILQETILHRSCGDYYCSYNMAPN